VIILHSAFGDDCRLLDFFSSYFDKRNCPLVAFIGNEYDLLPEKKKLLSNLSVNYICTQLPLSVGAWLYEDVSSACVIDMPHALNQNKYFDQELIRTKMLGFVGSLHPLWIGDNDRSCLINKANEIMLELNLKAEIDTTGRNLPSLQWARFLNESIATIGAESGTYYLDKSGQLLMNAKEIMKTYPSIGFNELYEKIFISKSFEVKSAKCVSSRHFEPIGTKTCQLLLEGSYNDLLIPDIHYIKIVKDMSNLKDAVISLLDVSHRTSITESAFKYVIANHTYDKRLQRLIDIVIK
jgi:hypothetical protein